METKIFNIYLDAGHGKHTIGKCSPDNSVTEWELNDRVCKFVENNLVKYNCNVYRCDDITGETDPMPLSTRLAVAEDGKADVLISVHHNIAGDGSFMSGEKATGVEVFIGDAYAPETKELAFSIIHNLVANTGMHMRGVKTGNLVMCTKMPFPTILVEGGFLNNKKDLEYIKSDKGVKAYAKSISSALIKFLGLTKDFDGSAFEQKAGSSEYVVSTAYENLNQRVMVTSVLATAIGECDKHTGYKVFDSEGKVVHESALKENKDTVKYVKVGSKGERKMTHGQTLKMRDAADAKSGSIVTEISYGEQLILISKTNSSFWLCRTLDGRFQGYMHNAYLNELN